MKHWSTRKLIVGFIPAFAISICLQPSRVFGTVIDQLQVINTCIHNELIAYCVGRWQTRWHGRFVQCRQSIFFITTQTTYKHITYLLQLNIFVASLLANNDLNSPAQSLLIIIVTWIIIQFKLLHYRMPYKNIGCIWHYCNVRTPF